MEPTKWTSGKLQPLRLMFMKGGRVHGLLEDWLQWKGPAVPAAGL